MILFFRYLIKQYMDHYMDPIESLFTTLLGVLEFCIEILLTFYIIHGILGV